MLAWQQNGGKTPGTYAAFCKLIDKPPEPLENMPNKLPNIPQDLNKVKVVPVPCIKDLGYDNLNEVGLAQELYRFQSHFSNLLVVLKNLVMMSLPFSSFFELEHDIYCFPRNLHLSPVERQKV